MRVHSRVRHIRRLTRRRRILPRARHGRCLSGVTTTMAIRSCRVSRVSSVVRVAGVLRVRRRIRRAIVRVRVARVERVTVTQLLFLLLVHPLCAQSHRLLLLRLLLLLLLALHRFRVHQLRQRHLELINRVRVRELQRVGDASRAFGRL